MNLRGQDIGCAIMNNSGALTCPSCRLQRLKASVRGVVPRPGGRCEDSRMRAQGSRDKRGRRADRVGVLVWRVVGLIVVLSHLAWMSECCLINNLGVEGSRGCPIVSPHCTIC